MHMPPELASMVVSDTAFIWFNTCVAVRGSVAGAAWAAANVVDNRAAMTLVRNMDSL
ncbi:hypothetical protein [Pseudoduganella lutea]|uniref:hypothetical protein n=1 Tax=Pseudoduganella lutea TaxID=321985 RepID=UPI0013EE8897|nr:hypothetical protein [Pseudoduganella lutea]